jgi:hypothetical protein
MVIHSEDRLGISCPFGAARTLIIGVPPPPDQVSGVRGLRINFLNTET